MNYTIAIFYSFERICTPELLKLNCYGETVEEHTQRKSDKARNKIASLLSTKVNGSREGHFCLQAKLFCETNLLCAMIWIHTAENCKTLKSVCHEHECPGLWTRVCLCFATYDKNARGRIALNKWKGTALGTYYTSANGNKIDNNYNKVEETLAKNHSRRSACGIDLVKRLFSAN